MKSSPPYTLSADRRVLGSLVREPASHLGPRLEQRLRRAQALGDPHAEAHHAHALRVAPPVERADLRHVGIRVHRQRAKLLRHAARVRLDHQVERLVGGVHVRRVRPHEHLAVGISRLDSHMEHPALAIAAAGRAKGGGERESESVHGQVGGVVVASAAVRTSRDRSWQWVPSRGFSSDSPDSAIPDPPGPRPPRPRLAAHVVVTKASRRRRRAR